MCDIATKGLRDSMTLVKQETRKFSQSGHPMALLADVGGTNVRFAYVINADARLQCVHSFSCAEYVHFEDALKVYLGILATKDLPRPVRACFAVAAAVQQYPVQMTNSRWVIDTVALEQLLGAPVTLLNDFSAQAWCLQALREEDLQWLQNDRVQTLPRDTLVRSVIGPGTGFGGATITADGHVLESEPGHVSFAPVNIHELNLLRQLWQRYPRVSIEHLLSGPGLANLYWANSCMQGDERELLAADIVAGARSGDSLCQLSVRDFIAVLGSVCGDIALSMGSTGGVYLSGNMLAQIGGLMDQNLFMTRFLAKGPFADWCARIPVARLLLPEPGLAGCAIYANRNCHASAA